MEQEGEPLEPRGYHGEADWATLLSRILEDFSRIIHMEIRLVEADLGRLLNGLIDRILAQFILLAALFGGGSCFLAALIVLLHYWLPWWSSLALGGVAVIIVGLAIWLTVQHRSTRTEGPVAAQ